MPPATGNEGPDTPQPTGAAAPRGRPRRPWLLSAIKRGRSDARPANRGSNWWQGSLQLEIGRLRTTLCNVSSRPPGDQVKQQVQKALREAEQILEDYEAARWRWRVGRGGKTYELALGWVFQAGEDLLLVADEAAVLAQVPVIKAGIRAYLGSHDPRTASYIRYLDQLSTPSTGQNGKDGKDGKKSPAVPGAAWPADAVAKVEQVAGGTPGPEVAPPVSVGPPVAPSPLGVPPPPQTDAGPSGSEQITDLRGETPP